MRIEGPKVAIGLVIIAAGVVLQLVAFRMPHAGIGGWAVIVYGMYLLFAYSDVTASGTPPSVHWVAFDDVPDAWENRMVWHYIEAYPGKKQQQPTTCIFSRLRFPQDQDGTGVYFALVDLPAPPSSTGDNQ